MLTRISILSLCILSFLSAQLQWYNHPELEWKTIESEHFKVHFHQGNERSAREAIEVAEYVYNPITELYEFVPKTKTEIIIKDVDDYSNGGAYFFENMIEIWSKPLDYDLRGSHRWMQDVIAHEFTHIVQIGKSMKYKRNLLGSYIQKIEYEEEKREDVLYGYPNQIISYPVMPGVALPMWLAEGTAQHMYNDIYFDYWDSIRDMILRDRVLNKKMYTFKQMGSFGKCGLGNEFIYNSGYSLVEYIVQNYGESSLKDISSSLSKPFNFSINRAIKQSIGISGDILYSNWKHSLEEHYEDQIKDINDNKNYIILESEGITNINPRWSPDENKIAYLSDKEHDRFGMTDLFYYSFSDSTHTIVQSGVKSIPTWINDSLIVYTKISKPNKDGSKFYDLYKYDLNKEKEEQLTFSLRLFSPIYDKETEKIIAINTFDGTSNLVVGNLDFTDYKVLTNFNNGLQISSVTLKDGNYLIDALYNHEKNLYLVDSKTGEISDYFIQPWDIRDPEFLNGKLIYSDDRGGIYNLYYKDDSKEGYITNVHGGAFKPDITEDGRIVFSIYQDGGYKLAYLDSFEIIGDYVGLPISKDQEYFSRPNSILMDKQFEGESKKYTEKMTGPFFFPKLMYDYGTVKPGF